MNRVESVESPLYLLAVGAVLSVVAKKRDDRKQTKLIHWNHDIVSNVPVAGTIK